MKLIRTKFIYDLPAILIVLLLGTAFCYFSIENLLEETGNKVLALRKEYAIKLMNEYSKDALEIGEFGDVFKFIKEDKKPADIRESIKDTLIYVNKDKEYLLFRELSFYYLKDNQYYHIFLRAPLINHEILLETFSTDILLICLLMALVLISLNVYISRKIWAPFYFALKNISLFNLDNTKTFKTKETSISEFKELNSTLSIITERLRNEYDELKSFSSNLTHELQTPLAVIKAHTDLLLQQENMQEEQLKSVLAIKHTVETVSQFEEIMILLKRIEFGEFNDIAHVNLSTVLKQKIDMMEELISLKEITLTTKIAENIEMNIHNQLLDILLNNLISNAIRHNDAHGHIRIELTATSLKISNTIRSEAKHINSKGLGLGLSLINSICKKYNFNISVERHSEYITTLVFN